MIRNLIRALITLVFCGMGVYVDYLLAHYNIMVNLGVGGYPAWNYTLYSLLVALLGFVGFMIAPASIRGFLTLIHWMEIRLQKIPTHDLLGGAVGIILGLVIANLFSNSLSGIPVLGSVVSVLLSIILGYLGLTIGARRKEDLLGLLTIFPKLRGGDKGEKTEKVKGAKAGRVTDVSENYKILDTSVIIDGRIADIVQTGFVEGTLLVPSFVLEELRHIADSSDLLKRNRGRRGLDILNQISKETSIRVHIHEQDFDDIAEVDSKLVRLGQVLDSPVLTNDYNLNKVAELQGVRVLNINELSNAVKPVVLPGEEMVVQVMKEGKEPGQGVAYLDDGTMIVVDMGRRFMGQHTTVLVTSVLQTAAGRMIFAKPKSILEKKQVNLHETEEVNALG